VEFCRRKTVVVTFLRSVSSKLQAASKINKWSHAHFGHAFSWISTCRDRPMASGHQNTYRSPLYVYDKKPRRSAKDNRTAHLTARSDKSVAYVTNNKKLYSTFCTVEANYWQTRSIARPLRQQSYLLIEQYVKDMSCQPSGPFSFGPPWLMQSNGQVLIHINTQPNGPGRNSEWCAQGRCGQWSTQLKLASGRT